MRGHYINAFLNAYKRKDISYKIIKKEKDRLEQRVTLTKKDLEVLSIIQEFPFITHAQIRKQLEEKGISGKYLLENFNRLIQRDKIKIISLIQYDDTTDKEKVRLYLVYNYPLEKEPFRLKEQILIHHFINGYKNDMKHDTITHLDIYHSYGIASFQDNSNVLIMTFFTNNVATFSMLMLEKKEIITRYLKTKKTLKIYLLCEDFEHIKVLASMLSDIRKLSGEIPFYFCYHNIEISNVWLVHKVNVQEDSIFIERLKV